VEECSQPECGVGRPLATMRLVRVERCFQCVFPGTSFHVGELRGGVATSLGGVLVANIARRGQAPPWRKNTLETLSRPACGSLNRRPDSLTCFHAPPVCLHSLRLLQGRRGPRSVHRLRLGPVGLMGSGVAPVVTKEAGRIGNPSHAGCRTDWQSVPQRVVQPRNRSNAGRNMLPISARAQPDATPNPSRSDLVNSHRSGAVSIAARPVPAQV
jgi:hypothetical protein